MIPADSFVSSEKKPEATAVQAKKILIVRPGTRNGVLPWRDLRNAKTWRYATQAVFALINLYLGVAFFLWVRHFETGAAGAPPLSRPDGVEGWLPIAGLMNLKYLLATWEIPPAHAAATFLLLAFLVISLLFKKSFCSWLCPVGTLSEILWKLGKRFLGEPLQLPRWLDIPLRSLKYLLLAFFLYISLILPAQGIAAFLTTPYGLIIDVKMLDFFRFMGTATLITLSVLVVLSLVIQNFWCRYLCPYGAFLGIFSMFSPFKIRRDANACIDCAKCAKVCPARLPVDTKLQISSAECTACMTCIEVCPAKDALQFSLPPQRREAPNGDEQGIARRWKGRKLTGALIALILFITVGGTILAARWSGYWESPISDETYRELIPKSRQFQHP